MRSVGPAGDGGDDELDDLPERIIVVRDSVEEDSVDADADADADVPAGRTIDIEAPSDPDQLQAELDALAAEVADVAAGPIDLDEVDLRSPGASAVDLDVAAPAATLDHLDPARDDARLDRAPASVDLPLEDQEDDGPLADAGHLAPATSDPGGDERDEERIGDAAPAPGGPADDRDDRPDGDLSPSFLDRDRAHLAPAPGDGGGESGGRHDDEAPIGDIAPGSTDSANHDREADAVPLRHLDASHSSFDLVEDHAEPASSESSNGPADDRAPLAHVASGSIDLGDDEREADGEALGTFGTAASYPADDDDLDGLSTDADAESLGHVAPAAVDPTDDEASFGHLAPADDGLLESAEAGDRRAELDAMVAQVAASQIPDDEEEHRHHVAAPTGPGRDETGPGTLRPKVPEPVVAARTMSASPSPSMARRTASRMRALLGLFFVVMIAGVGLAGAIGAAALLVVLVLTRAFGSG